MTISRVSHVAVALLAVVLASAAYAEPPAGAEERRGPPDGERRGPPSPERMVDHAMSFDADGDGKLDRAELTKFAEELHAMRMRGGPGGPGGQGGQGRGGQGAGRGPGRGGPPSGGQRPTRPPAE